MIDLKEHDIATPAGLTGAFAAALATWRGLANNAALQRCTFTREHAAALAQSPGSSAEKRKADADMATTSLALVSDQAEVDARAARFQVEFLVGLAGGRTVVER